MKKLIMSAILMLSRLRKKLTGLPASWTGSAKNHARTACCIINLRPALLRAYNKDGTVKLYRKGW